MRIVDRTELTDIYKDIVDRESHHDHLIFEFENKELRWKQNPVVVQLLKK